MICERTPHLIALDLDRTLLTTDKRITGFSSRALRALRSAGHIVIAATARPLRAVAPYEAELDAVVALSGGIGTAGGETVFRHAMPQDTAERIIAEWLERRPDATVFMEVDGKGYANFDWPGDPMPALDARPQGPVEKVSFAYDSPQELAELLALLPPEVYAEPCEGRYALIMPEKATKWRGVQVMAERFGIPVERIIAVGDDAGDAEMIAGAGVGVAMINAIPEVRDAAGFVTEHDNDNDGAARFLLDYLGVDPA